jgi:hypothetical protein
VWVLRTRTRSNLSSVVGRPLCSMTPGVASLVDVVVVVVVVVVVALL